MTLPEWLFRVLAISLLGVGAWVLVLSMWGDRLRGNTRARRCPRCWYSLEGASPREGVWLCPECGAGARGERDLHRTCRRWLLLLPSVMLALLGVGAWSWPTISRDGWRAAVPTRVIVSMWPVDEMAWMEGGLDPMADELGTRMGRNTVTRGALDAGAKRVAARYERVGRLAAMNQGGATGTQLLRVDCSALLGAMLERGDVGAGLGCGRSVVRCALALAGEPEPTAAQDTAFALEGATSGLTKVIESLVAPDSWADNGGADGVIRWAGTNLLVVNKPGAVADVGRLVDAFGVTLAQARERGAMSTRVIALEGDGCQVVLRSVPAGTRGRNPLFDDSERADALVREIEQIAPDSWADAGGEQGRAMTLGAILIVRHVAPVQEQIDALLERLSRE